MCAPRGARGGRPQSLPHCRAASQASRQARTTPPSHRLDPRVRARSLRTRARWPALGLELVSNLKTIGPTRLRTECLRCRKSARPALPGFVPLPLRAHSTPLVPSPLFQTQPQPVSVISCPHSKPVSRLTDSSKSTPPAPSRLGRTPLVPTPLPRGGPLRLASLPGPPQLHPLPHPSAKVGRHHDP